MISSTKDATTGIESAISQLKQLYGAATDDALAKRLGSTKSAVANWRRRGAIPAAVQQQVAKEYGPFAPGTFLEESIEHIRLFDLPRGLALYVYDRERDNFRAAHPSAERYSWWGFIVGDVERILRRYIREHLAGADEAELMKRCLHDIERRSIPDLEKLLAQLRAEVDE